LKTTFSPVLLAADRAGHILGERTQPGDYTGTATRNAELVIDVPISHQTTATPYRRLGDWFAGLCVLIAVTTLARAWKWRRPTPNQPSS
jgi:hypothetical protein